MLENEYRGSATLFVHLPEQLHLSFENCPAGLRYPKLADTAEWTSNHLKVNLLSLHVPFSNMYVEEATDNF